MQPIEEKFYIVVTGGAGYIGSQVCAEIHHAGMVPVCVDNFSVGEKVNARFGPAVECDILDTEKLIEVFRQYQPLAVMHLAALCSAPESELYPERYLRVNVNGTESVLRAMQIANIRRLVFSSTCAVYGHLMYSPVNESAPIDLINVYARSKYMAEQKILAASVAADIDAVVFRFFNAAGSDPESGLGERVQSSLTLIPSIIRVAQKNAKKIVVNGADYPTKDGTCVRDFLHVRDIASAHLLALEFLQTSKGVEIFNLGSEHGVSVRETLEAAHAVLGQTIDVEYGPRRIGDPTALWSDSSKAKEKLNWLPIHSNLEKILRSTWKWAKQKQVAEKPTPFVVVSDLQKS